MVGRTVLVARRALVAAVLVGVLGVVGCTPPPNTPALQADVDRLVAGGVPGVVSYTRQGDMLATPFAGTRDLRTGEVIRTTDRFRVGSITKAFVATVVLQLVGEGRLSLDDTVERWLPGVVPAGNGITVRQLLNHTSGVFDYLNDDPQVTRERLLAPYETNPDHVWTEAQLVAIATERPPNFAPGTGWRYSNTNYVLAGMIVRAVTGTGIDDEVTRRITIPLGLTNSYFPTSIRFILGDHSRGHLRGVDPNGQTTWFDVTDISPSLYWGAGAMVSSPADIAAFHRELLAGHLLPAAQQGELLRTVATGGPSGYGLGLISVNTPCGPAWGHDGAVFGYTAAVFSTADGGRQVALALNTNIGAQDTAWVDDFNEALTDGLCGVDTGQRMAPTPAVEAARRTVQRLDLPATRSFAVPVRLG
jgi:D-alanyl-D-alanine carboxypeptidase